MIHTRIKAGNTDDECQWVFDSRARVTMEVSLAGERLFEGHFIIISNQAGARPPPARSARRNVQLEKVINVLGEMSAKEQNLKQPITVFQNLENTNHKIYLSVEPDFTSGRGYATGFIKVGEKKLFVTDGVREQVAVTVLCVLDFYVFNSEQRKGWGKKTFDFMLQMENITPSKMAYDRPSPKLIMFLKKHYNLIDYIWQPNRYTIYRDFFEQYTNSNSYSTDNRSKANSSLSRLYSGRCLQEASMGISPNPQRRMDSIAKIIHGAPQSP